VAEQKKDDAEKKDSGGGSTLTVLLAGGVNLTIAIMKAIAGIITGSGAMLSESAHSVADTFTEIMLLTALRRSDRPADRLHPFGYGKERYFWSMLAAVSIFVSGSVFSLYQGVITIFGGEEEQSSPLVAYIVLAVSFAMESVSWFQAQRQVRGDAREHGQKLIPYLRTVDDPTAKTVLYEDSAALTGLVLAFAGVGLHHVTGSALFDGLASICIGLLLAGVAFLLGRTNLGLLIGRQANPSLVLAVRETLNSAAEVDTVVDLQTMLLGTDRVLVCARVDFDNSLSAGELERVCVRLANQLEDDFEDVTEVFIEPVPRTDPELREAVLNRYGDDLRD
jgi:cation diffusion facilitator family transporter